MRGPSMQTTQRHAATLPRCHHAKGDGAEGLSNRPESQTYSSQSPKVGTLLELSPIFRPPDLGSPHPFFVRNRHVQRAGGDPAGLPSEDGGPFTAHTPGTPIGPHLSGEYFPWRASTSSKLISACAP
jgi:hypothetical protein